jgi:hypothetical protein
VFVVGAVMVLESPQSLPHQALRTGGGLSVRVDAAEPALRNTRS